MSQAASAGPGSAAAAALCEAAAAFASAARASFAPQAAADLHAEGTDAASALAASLEAALGQPEGVRGASSAALECAEGAWAAQVEGVGWASPAWREAFVVGACLAAAEEAAAGGTAAALRRLDVACIMGAPQELLKGLVGAVLDAERDAGAEKEVEERGGKQGGRSASASALGPLEAIPRDATLSELPDAQPACERAAAAADGSYPAEAIKSYWERDVPCLLPGLARAWPAVAGRAGGADSADGCGEGGWADLEWWRAAHGARTVPLELGEQGGDGWREELSTVADFVDRYLAPSTRADVHAAAQAVGGGDSSEGSEGACDVGYMAQHHLLEQLPSLLEDIEVPAVCAVADGVSKINAWLGTRGTVSPCHYDSYDNVFVQVAGVKRMRIYPTSQSKFLYRCRGGWKGQRAWPSPEEQAAAAATGGGGKGTISAVDVEAPDLERFPRFAEARGFDVTLHPGDALYLPARCWHHVRAITTSISLSFHLN